MDSILTFQEISDLWRTEKQESVKRTTMAAYNLVLEKYILPYFTKTEKINDEIVQKFVQLQQEAGLSLKSIRDILTVLKMLLKFANKKGLLSYTELNIKLPKNKNLKTVSVFTGKQQRKLMRHLEKNPTSRNLGILMCLYTGLRIGELCALKWQDIDFEMSEIAIKKTMYRVYEVGKRVNPTELIISDPKTLHSFRSIPLPEHLIKILLENRPQEFQELYLLSGKESPIEPRTYRNYYYRILKELKLPQLKFHSLRHTFATRCIENDCDCKTVSEILGHADISTTLNLYMHPSSDQKRRCIEKMLKGLGK